MSNSHFHFSALFCILLLVFIFFSKKRVKSSETKLYGYMLISSLVDTVLELSILIIAANIFTPKIQLLLTILNKVDFIHFIVWPSLLFLYVVNISNYSDKTYKRIKNLVIIADILFIITEFFLPIELINNGVSMGVVGLGSTFVLMIVGLYLALSLIITILSYKRFNSKYMPVIMLLVMILIGVIVRLINPTILIMTAITVYIDLVMYFTIENPDVKMINELNMARDAADKANMAKSDFLSSMSHEIRTPLNAIVGLSEDNLKYKDSLIGAVVENTNDILNASQTLLEIVGNILDINKIESDKLELVNEPYNFNDEITSLVKLTSIRIGTKPITCSLNIAPDIPYLLLGDKGRVKEIVNNLFTNAIKYTSKGKIEINVKCINQNDICYLLITVSDTGKGIPKEKISRLFDRFDRLDAERNTTVEGTGLGLAITKKLVEMMNGSINVQSSIGIGSMFAVNIPQKIYMLNKPVVEEVDIPNIETSFGFKKILIVDDNNLNIKVATKALSDFNFEIVSVTSGEECLEKVKETNFDLILMDIMMPIMSGEEALKKLKEDRNFNTPVIALTADAVSGAKEKYLSEGFVDYISKPFNKSQIKEKLNKVFK